MDEKTIHSYKPGLAAVIVSIGAMMFWAFWGIIENFHEGWYSDSLFENIIMMFAQYLSPLFIIMALTLISIWKEKIGGALFIVSAAGIWLFTENIVLSVPMGIIGILFLIGLVRSKKPAYLFSVIIPLAVLIGFAVGPAARIAGRLEGSVKDSLSIEGNGISLVWAPRGPGFPVKGVSWDEAQRICAHLSDDGLQVLPAAGNFWRLPTPDEAVRSMMKQGSNCNGKLDEKGFPVYGTKPDKEFPLWDIHSQVIYYWTSEAPDSANALIIEYSGELWKKPKNLKQDNLGFRAVKKKN